MRTTKLLVCKGKNNLSPVFSDAVAGEMEAYSTAQEEGRLSCQLLVLYLLVPPKDLCIKSLPVSE